MKLKLLALMLFLSVIFTALVSCTFDFGGTSDKGNNEENEKEEGGEENKEPENLIYNEDSELYIIVDPLLENTYLSSFISNISNYRTEPVKFDSVDSEKHKHEIVIGNVDRAISRTATDRMNRIVKNSEDEYSYLVYSDGSSIALVWEEDGEGVTLELALKHLCENYLKSELIMKSGVDSETYDLVEDYYGVIDSEYKQEAWSDFEKTYGNELTAAYKQLYAICSSDSVVWLANLYDSDICVCVDLYGEDECSGTKYCGTGGFYFSNSGRDNKGYLPDAESTGQAIGLLEILGLAYKRGGNAYYGVLTEEMRQRIGDFAYALGEPNGYFYHPQWSKELIDGLSSRRSRDMSHCIGILQSLGRKPKYTTATGVPGEDVLGVSCELTGRLGRDAVSAVSYVVLSASDSYDPNLQDLDSFKIFLSELDIRNQSYPVGNTLTAMTSQIQERDRQIGTADDPTPLMDYLISWLNDNQNHETGTWDYKKPGDTGYGAYDGVNGLLKISGIYKAHKVVMPYSREAASSAIKAISDPTPINAVVDIYNTWFVLYNIVKNVRDFGGVEGALLASEIVAELRVDAPETILITRDKLLDFIRPDGSASYYKDKSCPVSQGAPVAVSGPVEGDVNATTIVVGQIIGLVANALEIPKISIFGEVERALFLKTIEGLGPVVKNDTNGNAEAISFDDDETGEPSSAVEAIHNGTGSATVVKDPRGKGNVLYLVSHSGTSDTVKVHNTNNLNSASTYVFEGDFAVNSAQATYSIQITMGDCYMLTFKMIEGRLMIYESSSASGANAVEEYLGISPELGNWFSLRAEYYPGDHDGVRIKVYADTDLSDGKDMKLVAVSDNYYDGSGVKVFKGSGNPSETFKYTTIFVLSAEELDMYLDNLNSFKSNIKYEPAGENDTPYINIDPKDSDRITYDFSDEIDSSISVKGGADIASGKLSLSGGGEVNAPVNVRTQGARCAYIDFTLSVDESSLVGSTVTLRALDGEKAIFDYQLLVEAESGGKYLSVIPKGTVSGEKIEGVKLPLGEEVRLTLEYFHDGDMIILYVNENFVGAASYLYADGNKRRMDSFALICGSGAALSLDALTVEMKRAAFEDAVAPKIPSKVHDFEKADEELSLSGGASVTNYGTGGVLKLDPAGSRASLTLSANVRSAVANKAFLKFELSYTNAKNGTAGYININDKSGNTILSYALVIKSGKTELYEMNKGGMAKTPLYTYSSVSGVTVEIEIYPEKNTVYVVSSGKKVAKSGVFVGAEYLENGISTLKLTTGNISSVSIIDNLQFETLYGVYENVTVSGTSSETNLKDGVDFESSNSGNLPSFIQSALVSPDASIGVTNLYNGVTEEYSNVLAFSAVAGTNDAMSIVKNGNALDHTVTAFEADLMVDLNSEGYSYQIFFSDTPLGNRAYLLQIEHRAGKVILTDNSNSNNNAGKNQKLYDSLNAGEWFNLRVEYYKSTMAKDLRVKVFVNGELIAVSDNFYGSESPTVVPGSLINCVTFYSLNSTDGFVYMDNLRFYDFDGICTDDVKK